MRTNVYEEELTGDVDLVRTRASGGTQVFFGARCYLKSPKSLMTADDDRSAVTFWFTDERRSIIMRDAMKRALEPYSGT